jgi:CheY-like chemotaxis protein
MLMADDERKIKDQMPASTNHMIRVLLVEDDRTDAYLIQELLSEAGVRLDVRHADKISSALECLEE